MINRLQNLYKDNLSIVVVNNIEGKCIKNIRLSLRQGNIPSMCFFAYGIDPLISYLDKRLYGILKTSMPLLFSSLLLDASYTEIQLAWSASSCHLESGEDNSSMQIFQLLVSTLCYLTTWTWWVYSWGQVGHKQERLMVILSSRELPTPLIPGALENSWVCQCAHGL